MAKKCNAEDCNNNVFGGGYCKNHQYLRPKKEARESKLHLYLKKDSAEYQSLTSGTEKDEGELELWFQKKINAVRGNPICEECGALIPDEVDGKKTDRILRAAVSHILGKADYPSVATHEYNEMRLCAGNGCHRASEVFETLQHMKVYPKVLLKFKLFMGQVKETHKKRYKEFLNAIGG